MENEQFTVLVTGFGPFGIHKVNASWEAVKELAELFNTWEKSLSIKLIVEEIPVAYNHVSSKVKDLWKKYKPSIILHVGVSSVANCLEIECQAGSNGYTCPDIFNECPKEDNIENVTLKTDCNLEKLCEIVNMHSHKTGCEAKISENAGKYLCEYIYYNSLAIGEPQVLFVHVPDLSKYSTAKSAQGLFNILTHLIECTMEQKLNEVV